MNPSHKEVTKTVAKAAAKTFAQAFLSIMVLLLVPVLTSWTDAVSNGGTVTVDTDLIQNVLIAATGAGIAALLSLAYNWSRS